MAGGTKGSIVRGGGCTVAKWQLWHNQAVASPCATNGLEVGEIS